MRKVLRELIIVSGGLWLAACATNQQPYDGQPALSPEERRLQSVEDQLAVVNRRLNAVDSANQNAQVSGDLRDLRGQIEELQHQQQQNTQQLNALNQRLQRIEAGGAMSPPASATSAMPPASGAVGSTNPPVAGTAAATSSAAPAQASPDEQAAYIRSFNLLQSGKLDDAISGFKSMLAQYPQGNFADNAWYWLGSAYYVKGDAGDALSSFKSLLSNFPNSPKVPDALLKTGMIYQDQHKDDLANTAFKRVIDTYPTSNAATLAKQRMAKASG